MSYQFKKTIGSLIVASLILSVNAHAADSTKEVVANSLKEVGGESLPPAPIAAADGKMDGKAGDVAQKKLHEELNPKLNPAETLMRERLTPEEIIQVRKVIQDEINAKELPLAGRAEPVVRSIQINLAPDATPPIARISKGAGATIVFTKAGQPVEVEAFINFAKNYIAVNEFGKNVLAISALTGEPHNAAFAVQLKGVEVPVQFTVLTAQPVTDYRIDAYLPSPNISGVSSAFITQSDSELSTAMMFAMSNILPDGYKKGVASSGQVFLKKTEDSMIYRVRGTLISPALPESARMESPDGMKCYYLPVTGILSVIINGQVVTVKVEGV